MADIEDKIQKKYDINIKTTNILKLYKIEQQDITPEELESKIAACRKKWQQSINGANEKFAKRDQAYLEQADSFEKVLRDSKLRKELFAYYYESKTDNVDVEFARSYFKLVGSTVKIHKKEVEFFFSYYPEQRKNKKAIQEMLKSDFKVMDLGSDKEQEQEEKEAEGKKKGNSSFISNLFQEATISNLRKCELLLEKASASEEVCKRYPEIKGTMYEFLTIDKMESYSQFKSYVEKMRIDSANLKYDRGQDYAPLVDCFNNLANILEYSDVMDNYGEFKLLIQYPKLTPYMFLFEDMKVNTLNKFYSLACEYYGFRDLTDFILTYFKPIHDNFGIYDQAIKGILKKAEKKTGQKKIFDKIDKTFGLSKSKKMSFGVFMIHILTYWPVYLLFGIFELAKFVVDNLRYIALVGAVPMLIYNITKMNQVFEKDILILKTQGWYEFIDHFWGVTTGYGFEVAFVSLEVVIVLFMCFILPTILGTAFLWNSASCLTKRYDWIGIERTLKSILAEAKQRTTNRYEELKNKLISKRIVTIIGNILCVVVFVFMVIYGSKGVVALFQKSDFVFSNTTQDEVEETTQSEEQETETYVAQVDYYEITVDTANIRADAGTEYEVVMLAQKGERFAATGASRVASNGTTWYEIYLDENHAAGWASEKVISLVSQ